ncbi:MAG: FadR family transcriptional regulator [Rhizobiaceae bacterium]|nr:FadR family transcriptional regulator [Rhizobiaceae bacterium]
MNNDMGRSANRSSTMAQEARLGRRQQVKLSDQVYEVVLKDIVQGRYPEGAKLPTETLLAQEFAVSRPVVREALARLRDDGLIQPRQGAGSFVLKRPGSALLRFAPIGSIADIQRCFEFRLAVEPMAARLAAARRDEAVLDKIDATLRSLRDAVEMGTVDVESDFAFHKAVADASGNAYFSTTLHSLEQSFKTAMLLNRQLSLLNPSQRLNLVLTEHRVVYEAILAKDEDAASTAMHRHIQDARRRVFDGDSPRPAEP